MWSCNKPFRTSSFVPLRLSAFALNLLTLTIATTIFAAEPDRSPVDLVLGPDDAWLATINQTADSVSLVRTADSKVLAEEPVGDHPIGIALAPDGNTLLVSNHYSGELTLLAVQNDKFVKT